jgi:hypothetical protein
MTMSLYKTLAILAAVSLAACSKNPETQPEPETVGARINNNLEAPIARGDCREATKRALANPNIDVEKVATPLAMTPPPVGKIPKGVTDRNGWFNVKFHVLVDTLGRADMKTFTVDTSSHPWFANSVRGAVAKWRFAPAEVAGCKIPRKYSLGISPKNKTPASSKATTKAPATKAPAKKPPTA